MITCVVHYTIDPGQIEALERFAREWMRLVAKHGGIHHGYFLPAEGASDQAEALFSFDSLAVDRAGTGTAGHDHVEGVLGIAVSELRAAVADEGRHRTTPIDFGDHAARKQTLGF
jgi:hypothetical protein